MSSFGSARARNTAVQAINFSVPTSGWPTTGAATNEDTFLTVPQDLEFDDGYVFFDANESEGAGTVRALLVQQKNDGDPAVGAAFRRLSSPVDVTEAKTRPIRLGAALDRIDPELPIYIRFTVSPEGSGTQWWQAVSAVRGTVNFLTR